MSAAIQPDLYRSWNDLPPAYGRNIAPPPLFRPTGPHLSLHYREYSQSRPTCSQYQTWWSKHHVELPATIHGRMKEKYGPQVQSQWPFEAERASSKYHADPAFRVKYPKPDPLDDYHRGLRRDVTCAETKRARGMYGNDRGYDDMYQYSNVTTGAGYRRPVFSVYGPLLKDKYCGVNWQHNRHGNMNFDDHY